MGVEFTPSVKDLELEGRQVRAIRAGFQLLAAYFAIQLLLFLFQLFSAADAPETDQPAPIDRQRTVILVAVSFGLSLFTLVPGAMLHFRAGRTLRWRRASLALVGTVALELVAAAVWISTLDATNRPEIGQPLAARVSASVAGFLAVVEFWWTAVIIAEFAAACRATPVVVETEYLGYVVLGTGLAVLVLATWTLTDPAAAADDFTKFLAPLIEMANIVLTVWSFRLVLASAALARLVHERIAMAGRQLADKEEKA